MYAVHEVLSIRSVAVAVCDARKAVQRGTLI
jgi:hypothetical protein